MDSLYTDKPAGLAGNEDVGQMSAWYVLSALGFYQVNPSNGMYVFGSPVMDEVTLAVNNEKTFHIIVKDNSRTNKYIQQITFNDKAYTKSFFLYKDFMAGGEMTIQMGAAPSKTWGVSKTDWPHSSMPE